MASKRKWDDSRNQIGLELVQINVQRSVESQRRCNRGNNLGNQSIEVREARRNNAEILLANVVNGLVVNLYPSDVSIVEDRQREETYHE